MSQFASIPKFSAFALGVAENSSENPSPSFVLGRRNVIGSAISWAAAETILSTRADASESEPSSISPVPTVQLGSLEVSRTIQGYWQLAGGHGKYRVEDAIGNMKEHCKC